VTTGQGSEITFALNDIGLQLRRWLDIFDIGQKMNRGIASLDLAVSNNIPARWLDANAATTVVPKITKPLRLKKNHV
jgi:hypothetical protein